MGKKITRYILAVIPGDTMVDFQAVKSIFGSTYVAFASSDIAERLAGSVAGTILPFSFNEELELVVDPSLLENDEMYFNAARLDRSIVLSTHDYISVANPRLGHIAKGRYYSLMRLFVYFCIEHLLQSQEALRVTVCDLLFVGRANRQLFQEGACLHHRSVGIISGEHDPVNTYLQ